MLRIKIALLVCFFVAPLCAKAAEGYTGTIRMVLYNALAKDKHIIFEGEAENGRWDRLGGIALSHNNGDHYGFVQEFKAANGTMTIRMLATIGADMWVSGGEATYQVDLKGNGSVMEGTFSGKYNDNPVSGKATCELGPPRPMRIKDYKPLDPTERPRLLFRKHDLPWIQERLKTPLGQAYLEANRKSAAAGDLVALGMLYQLTGDKAAAERAQKIIEGFNHNLSPEGGGGTGFIGHQLVAIAFAYDLCYEAWPAEFRITLTEDLDREVSFMQRSLAPAGANFHPCSNFYGPGRGAPAIASLAMFGEKGPPPRKPVAPEEIETKGDLQAKLWAKTGKLDQYKAQYPRMLALYEANLRTWEQTGGAHPDRLAAFYNGFLQMNRHYRYGMGDGGYGAETKIYSDIANWYPLVYNTCYMRMFGKEASFRPDVRMTTIRRMVQTVFFADGSQRHDMLGPIGGWPMRFVAANFPVIPEEYKPYIKAMWNHVARVTEDDPSTLGGLLTGDSGGLYLAHVLLHYPLELKAIHPRQGMTKTWVAPYYGWYGFRNGYEGGDDFVFQVHAMHHLVKGWRVPCAGSLRLWGLGHQWAAGYHAKEGYRSEEPVVLLPEDTTDDIASGRTTHYQAMPDGSATLTVDLNDIYGTTKLVEARRKAVKTKTGGIVIDRNPATDEAPKMARSALYDYNGLRFDDNWEDSGITGLRAFGIDYSGKCGAPALLVLVDKIQGGKKRDWNWQIPSPKDGAPTVKAEGNTFTMSYSDASMKAIFVSPDVKIDPSAPGHIDYRRWQGATASFRRISATADSGSFFVILTLQRGAAPAVKVEGTGLDAKVTVGQQTVRFDGQKVIFGN